MIINTHPHPVLTHANFYHIQLSLTLFKALNPESKSFQLLADSLLSVKGIIHEFITLFDKQFSAISILESFELPSETSLKN